MRRVWKVTGWRAAGRTAAGWTVAGTVAVVAATGLVAPVAANAAVPDRSGTESLVVDHGQIRSDGTVVRSQQTVRATSSYHANTFTKQTAFTQAQPGKLSPKLAAAIARPGAATARQRLVVTFREDQQVPRLPDLDTSRARSAPFNAQVLSRTAALVSDLKAARAPGYQTLSTQLAPLGVRTVNTFWLIKGVEVDAPLSAVPALVARDDVQYVEPADSGAAPPADGDPNNDEVNARALMRTDPYFNLNQTGGFIGLLDTGVRSTQQAFTNPSHLGFLQDLTNPSNPNPQDDCWNHGTSTAAIITGNGNLGANFRGISAITLDSFKVYPSGCGNLNISAAVQGFQSALNVGDRVIVAEMQPGGTDTDSLSTAADSAFDAGAVIIAANGNNGPNASTVSSPALAQKALGIGASDLETQTVPNYSGRGPVADGRVKPDILAPTNVETASASNDTSTQVFTGTSCATPHAAGAAALVRNFLRGGTGNVDPGQVYAYMIANTNQLGTGAAFDNTNGAGMIRLLVNGTFWRNTASITNGQTLDIPLAVPASSGQRFNVAIWWPEAPATHNDVDLQLVDPTGTVRATSASSASIFERVSIDGPIAGGTWKVRIHGFHVVSSSQLVNWVAVNTPV